MKSVVNASLEAPAPNYESVMESMNVKLKNIEEQQLVHFEDSSIKLETPEGLKSKQQYTYSVEDLMVNKRADVDFFEFVSIKRTGLLNNQEEEYIDVTPNLITGVAPVQEGLYMFDVTLKYTNFTNGGQQKAIDTQLKLWVGAKPDRYSTEEEMNTILKVVIVVLVVIFVLLLGIQIYNQ